MMNVGAKRRRSSAIAIDREARTKIKTQRIVAALRAATILFTFYIVFNQFIRKVRHQLVNMFS